MRNTRWKVVGMGDLVTDLIAVIEGFPIQPSRHQILSRYELQPGGMGNFLIAGARLGMEMVALDVLGDDLPAKTIIDIFDLEGVDTSKIILKKGNATKVVLALTDSGGEHVFLSCLGEGFPEQPLVMPWRNALANADGLMVVGYAFLESHLRDALLSAMKLVRGAGKTVLFDPGPLAGRIPEDVFQQALASTEVLLVTDEELGLVCEGEVIPACKKILSLGIKAICIKSGPSGCRILSADQDIQCPGYQVRVRDTNGAGDSFAAAFCYGYLSGWPAGETGKFANAMGAAKVQKVGSGQNVPTLEEVKGEIGRQGIKLTFFEK